MNPHTSLLESLNKIASFTTKLDPSTVPVVFFARLSSLQTIIKFMGAQVSDDDVLRALTAKLHKIALNLNMEHLEWPFAAEDKGDILTAIAHIESWLGAAEPGSISLPVTAKDIALDPSLTAKEATYASGSSVHFNLDHTVTGNIDGSFLSNNSIHFDADPALRQGVGTLVGHAIDAETIKKHKEFLEWISKLDFQATQNETFAKHAAGTGDWFFKQQKFVDWKDGKTKFLWCPGILPSLLSICAVQFCSLRLLQQEAQTPIQLLGSVLKQLAQQHPVLSDHLLALHKKYLSRGDHPSIDELFKALQAELLVTSRDILSISQEFNNMARIPIEAHDEDLETYIRGRITTDKKLKKLVKEDVNLTTEIIEQVSLKAAGMFLQARLHLDALASQLNRKGLHKALALLPDRIMDSYDEAMAHIKAQGKDQYELAHWIFYWLAYAKSPLSVKELQHAVAVSEDMTEMDLDAIVDVDILTDSCAGLIVIQEQRSYHSHGYDQIDYTAQEYFQQKQKLVFPDIHHLMAITCLTYLSFNAFNSTSIRLDTWKQYPLYKYANSHWGTHVKADEAATKPHILKFLEKKNNVAYAAHQGDWPTSKTMHILAWLGLDHILELLLSQNAKAYHGWIHGSSASGSADIVCSETELRIRAHPALQMFPRSYPRISADV
ncbi:hypothetical protein C8J56DRAFT_1025613 [Mycena floridula]|nr:hypothetical protein C8J56DRAFT_1025613 [Mycena floridula]